MADMELGGAVITRNPNRINRVIAAKRVVAAVPTMEGVAFFSWR